MDELKSYFNRADCPSIDEPSDFEVEGLALHILSTIEFDGIDVLSLGCGNGRVERMLVKRAKPRHLTCLDYSERHLSEASKQLPGASFVLMDLNQFRREELGTYDLIYAASIAQYFSEPQLHMLNLNLNDCLNAGGRLVHFNVPDARRAQLYRINNAIVMEDWRYLLPERDFIDPFSRWCHREEFFIDGYETLFRTPSYHWERFDALLDKKC
ncbi:MAG: class I SAM-dependent methyltransferase [Selenomonadaceae bacterium]|nr:class I SAM-dependent methyltransferase [Selenomonadaceae bacterium]